MFSSSSQRLKSGTGKSKVNNSHVWFNLESKQKCSDKPQSSGTWLHFDSELEFSVWLSLSNEEKKTCWLHHKLLIAEGIFPIHWKPDFYFPLSNTIIEAKGGWINERRNKADKALFITQCSLAVNRGYRLIILSDSEFEVGKFTAHDYRNLRSLI